MFLKVKNVGCATAIVVAIINLTCGAWSIGEILSWFGKDIPFWGDGLIGLILGQFSVPIAVIGWVLRVCGVF